MRAAAGRGDRRDGGSRRAEFNDKIEREKAVFKQSRLYYEQKAKLLTWSAILLTTLAALISLVSGVVSASAPPDPCEGVADACYVSRAAAVLAGSNCAGRFDFANSTEEASESFARVGGVSGFLSLLSSAIGLLAATVTTVARSFMYGEKAADFQKVERELTELGKMLESYHRSAGGEPFSEQQWTQLDERYDQIKPAFAPAPKAGRHERNALIFPRSLNLFEEELKDMGITEETSARWLDADIGVQLRKHGPSLDGSARFSAPSPNSALISAQCLDVDITKTQLRELQGKARKHLDRQIEEELREQDGCCCAYGVCCGRCRQRKKKEAEDDIRRKFEKRQYGSRQNPMTTKDKLEAIEHIMEIGQFGRPRTDPLDLSHAHDADKPDEQQRAWQVVEKLAEEEDEHLQEEEDSILPPRTPGGSRRTATSRMIDAAYTAAVGRRDDEDGQAGSDEESRHGGACCASPAQSRASPRTTPRAMGSPRRSPRARPEQQRGRRDVDA